MTNLLDTHNVSDEDFQPEKPSRAAYEIYIKDHLDSCWLPWFEGWEITNLSHGEVRLSCSNIDQPGLHGVLNKIRDLNLTLISVKRIDQQSQE